MESDWYKDFISSQECLGEEAINEYKNKLESVDKLTPDEINKILKEREANKKK
jgi:hypothetical protein